MAKIETVQRKSKILHFEAKFVREKHFVGFHVPNVITEQIWDKNAQYARIEYDVNEDCLIIIPLE